MFVWTRHPSMRTWHANYSFPIIQEIIQLLYSANRASAKSANLCHNYRVPWIALPYFSLPGAIRCLKSFQSF